MRRPLVILSAIYTLFQTQQHAHAFVTSASISESRVPRGRSLANAETVRSDPVIKSVETHEITKRGKVTSNLDGILDLVRKNSSLFGYATILILLKTWTDQLSLSKSILKVRGDMIFGGIIFTIGDYGAQLLAMKMRETKGNYLGLIDNQRLCISSFLGTAWAGLLVPKVYGSVENFLPGRSVRLVVTKMVLTCSILSTIGNYANMFIRRWLKRTCDQWSRRATAPSDSTWRDLKVCFKSCNEDIMSVIRDDLKIWPLYDIICFALIPPVIRPITSATMSSLWSLYMSLASAKEINNAKK